MNRLLPVLAFPLLGVFAVIPLAHGVSVNVTYTYDAIGRLTRAGYSTGQAFQYTFDKAGNLSRVAYTKASAASDAQTEAASRSAQAAPSLAAETPPGALPVLDLGDLPTALRELLDAHTASLRDAYATADGARILFETDAALLDEDTNGVSDLYLYDAQSHALERISVTGTGDQANAPSTGGRLDGAGERVVFVSEASNLVTDDTNDVSDLFIRDLRSNTTERISLGLAGEQADGASHSARLDASGEWVVFVSEAGNLVADDANGVADVFLRDLVSGATDRLSLEAAGLEAEQASTAPAMDDTARVVAYERPDADGREQVYVVEVPDGHGLPVDVSSTLTDTWLRRSHPAVSADGRYLAAVLRDESGATTGLWIERRETATSVKLPWPAQAQTDEPVLLFSEQGQFLLLRQNSAGEASTEAARLESWVIVRNPLQSN